MRYEPPTPEAVLEAIRSPFLKAAPERVDPPVLQPLGTLLDLAGEALRSRLFVVQGEGGGEACLRPDFTVPVARVHLGRGGGPGRYFYEGRAFRASRPGSSQPEEFLQVGLEVYGIPSSDVVAMDVEICALAWRAAAAGGREDLELGLGDAGLFGVFIDALGLDEPLRLRLRRAAGRPRRLQGELARTEPARGAGGEGGVLASILSGLTETQAEELLTEIWGLAGVEQVGGRGAGEIAQRLLQRAQAERAPALSEGDAERIRRFLDIVDEPRAALERVAELGSGASGLEAVLGDWGRRLDSLAHAGVPVERARFATAAGRSFDYYDGLTFEIRSLALGPERPVAAGGRYDSLLARLGGAGGERAVGAMVRPWRAFSGGEA